MDTPRGFVIAIALVVLAGCDAASGTSPDPCEGKTSFPCGAADAGADTHVQCVLTEALNPECSARSDGGSPYGYRCSGDLPHVDDAANDGAWITPGIESGQLYCVGTTEFDAGDPVYCCPAPVDLDAR